MTRGEAIDIIENKIQIDVRFCTKEEVEQYQEALTMAITALRPVSRERIAELPRCEHCKDGKSFDGQMVIMGNKGVFPLNFCPLCGFPLTDEAVEMVMERLEALHEAN